MECPLQRRIVLVLAAALLSSIAVAQAPIADPSAIPSQVTVDVAFFVEDNHGRPLKGIVAKDFSILDDKNPHKSIGTIRTAQELPLRLGILIDSSSSERVSPLYKPGLGGMNILVNHLLRASDDKVFIVNFSSTVEVGGFMSREEFIQSNTNATPGGGTALFDAVHLACKERMAKDSAPLARRILVLLTDGDDNMSRVTANQMIEDAQRAGVAIFAVSTGPPLGGDGDGKLRQLAEKTGGLAFLQLDVHNLPRIFDRIEKEIDNMSLIGYIPQELGKQNQPHAIEIRAVPDKKLKIRAPKAYYPVVSAP